MGVESKIDERALQLACMADLGRARQDDFPLSDRQKRGPSYIPTGKNGTDHIAPAIKQRLQAKWGGVLEDEEAQQMDGLRVLDARPWAKKIAKDFMEKHADASAPPKNFHYLSRKRTPQTLRDIVNKPVGKLGGLLPPPMATKPTRLQTSLSTNTTAGNGTMTKPLLRSTSAALTGNVASTSKAVPTSQLKSTTKQPAVKKGPAVPVQLQDKTKPILSNGGIVSASTKQPAVKKGPAVADQLQDPKTILCDGDSNFANTKEPDVKKGPAVSDQPQDMTKTIMCYGDFVYVESVQARQHKGKFTVEGDLIQDCAFLVMRVEGVSPLTINVVDITSTHIWGVCLILCAKRHDQKITWGMQLETLEGTMELKEWLDNLNRTAVQALQPSDNEPLIDFSSGDDRFDLNDVAQQLQGLVERIIPECAGQGLEVSDAEIDEIEDVAIARWRQQGFLKDMPSDIEMELLDVLRSIMRFRRKAKKAKNAPKLASALSPTMEALQELSQSMEHEHVKKKDVIKYTRQDIQKLRGEAVNPDMTVIMRHLSEMTTKRSWNFVLPKDSQIFMPPKESQKVMPPKESQNGMAPKESQIFMVPKECQVFTAPKGCQVFTAPKEFQNVMAPKESPIFMAPKESQNVIVPKETQISMAPKESQTFVAPKESQMVMEAKKSEVRKAPGLTSSMWASPDVAKGLDATKKSVETKAPHAAKMPAVASVQKRRPGLESSIWAM